MSNLSPADRIPSLAPRGALHLALWLVQALLALVYLGAGAAKLTQPLDQLLANGMTFVASTPGLLVRFIGASEVLGALGLILPAATRRLPQLTGVAAAALATVMVLAVGVHLALGEVGGAVPALLLGALAGFVAWGRLVRAPIPARR